MRVQHILVSHNSSIRRRPCLSDGYPQLYKVCLLLDHPWLGFHSLGPRAEEREGRRPACQKTSFSTWPAGQKGGVDPVGGPGLMIEALKKLWLLRTIYIRPSATWTCVLHTSLRKKGRSLSGERFLYFSRVARYFMQSLTINSSDLDRVFEGKLDTKYVV